MEDNIFPFMDNINVDSYEQFIKDVDESRAKMLDADKKLVKAPSDILEWEHIEDFRGGGSVLSFREFVWNALCM